MIENAPIERFEALSRALEDAPRPLLVVMRHSTRGPIPLDPGARDVPLLPEGLALARSLGQHCRWMPRRVWSSPMLRCTQTARAFAEGVTMGPEPWPELKTTSLLGAPGAYIRDADAAWEDYLRWRKHALVRTLYTRAGELRGYHPHATGVARLLEGLLGSDARGLVLAFSHDILMSATLSWVADRPWEDADWPDFHEGFAIHRDPTTGPGTIRAWYRGRWSSRSFA